MYKRSVRSEWLRTWNCGLGPGCQGVSGWDERWLERGSTVRSLQAGTEGNGYRLYKKGGGARSGGGSTWQGVDVVSSLGAAKAVPCVQGGNCKGRDRKSSTGDGTSEGLVSIPSDTQPSMQLMTDEKSRSSRWSLPVAMLSLSALQALLNPGVLVGNVCWLLPRAPLGVCVDICLTSNIIVSCRPSFFSLRLLLEVSSQSNDRSIPTSELLNPNDGPLGDSPPSEAVPWLLFAANILSDCTRATSLWPHEIRHRQHQQNHEGELDGRSRI